MTGRCDMIQQQCMYVLQEGNLYNTDDGRKALRDIFALNLFENVQVCHLVQEPGTLA